MSVHSTSNGVSGGQIGLDLLDHHFQILPMEHDALEELSILAVVGVLIERQDVAAVPGYQRRDRCDQPLPVWAVHDEARVIDE